MKLTPLLISILVFLMSGVNFLFSTQDVHAQVPQTKRSEQDSFLKNIRAKKRNNDMQKARQGRGKSNENNKSKFRIRYLNGTSENNVSDDPEDVQKAIIKSLNIIYKSFGIGVNKTDTIRFHKNRLSEESNFINYNILFSFGEILNFTIGRSFYNTAEIYKKHTLNDGREVEIKSNNIRNYENFYLGLINTLSLSYKINFVEFLFSYNASWITFKDYECPANDCEREELSEVDFGGPVVEAYLFGLGIVF